MDHGKILALDTPAALKKSVGADTIVTIKADGGSCRRSPSDLRSDRRGYENALDRRRRGAARERAPSGSFRVSWARLREAGFDLADLSVAEPSLETVFISLTGKELRD